MLRVVAKIIVLVCEGQPGPTPKVCISTTQTNNCIILPYVKLAQNK